MKLISVEAAFAPADLDRAVTLFEAHASDARAIEGCHHYVLFKNIDSDGVAILQQWDTMVQFDAYRTSEAFAKLGAGLKPLMTAPPVTTIAEVDIA